MTIDSVTHHQRSIVAAAEAMERLERFDSVVDVRSESEFALDHIPGAINCPVLSDPERAEVGTTDRQQSSFDARRRGAVYVSRNIARHIETTFESKPKTWQPLVYCWRGGNRSRAMTHVLQQIGWRAQQLEGGYRAYRRQVLISLDALTSKLSLRVICGMTGSGKSRLLQQLASAGAQVLDLEALAQHRGSVLGGLPSMPQPSQKMFESRLWTALRGFDVHRPVFVESESRKIGALRVPDRLLDAIRSSACVRLEVPLDIRIRLLRDDYRHLEQGNDALQSQLDCLTELHGRNKVAQWKRLADGGGWDALVEQLLTEHYDPAYIRSIDRNFRHASSAAVVRIDSDAIENFEAAARALAC